MSNKEYRPTLAQLRTFVTIAENRHFGTAANKLGISQPSLSQALTALENGLGIQLIERSTRKVIVTAAGEDLLPLAKTTLEAADAFLSQSRGAHGALAGPLTIGIIPTVTPYIIATLLHMVHAEYPELEPRIVEEKTDHLLTQLRDGQLDIAIVAMPAEASGMVEKPLYTEKFALAVPEDHHLAGRKDLSLDDLDNLNLLLLDDGHCLRDQVLDLCRRASLNPSDATNTITRASSLSTITQLVAGGLGSTLIPASAIDTHSRVPGVATAEFADHVPAQREIGMVYRSSSTRVREFAGFGELVTRAFSEAVAQTEA